ncbi:histidine--tRNA ligase [Patescibacteria group bacterium]|nr:histidine--tRNA ligase [Patescibacteria group bacterium]
MSDLDTPSQSGKQFRALRGMRDILPEDAALYRRVENTLWDIAGTHGFQEIRTPVLEATELFTRTVGEETDIVHKEMYTFEDRSNNQVTLRPEGTAPAARVYLQHGFTSRPQPVKLAYTGNMYRYERPQAGRFREHEQFGLEVFGSADPAMDAHIITVVWQALEMLGIKNLNVQVNSIGEAESKAAIRAAVVKALTPVSDQLSEDAKRQLVENPMRVLDSKDPDVQKLLEKVPPLIDELTDDDRQHFTSVLEFLDQGNVSYELNPRLVRGLDYYTRTVFEVWGEAGGQSSLVAGGRYDGLVKTIGGPDTPAVGCGMGVDRIVEALKAGGQESAAKTPQVLIVQLGDEAKQIAFDLVDQLTRKNISAMAALGKDGLRDQLKQADKLGVPLALILGQKEVLEKSIIIRDMTSGMQETVPLKEAAAEVKRRLPSDVKSGKDSSTR